MSKKGRGMLDICTITTAKGGVFTIASDTGCTSPLVTETLITSGKLLNLKTETKSTVQVAGGKRILGTNHTCLLPIKRTNSDNTNIETVATSVPQIIENIPTIDITELTKNVYEEYKTKCEESNTQPRSQLENLPTKY